MLTRGIGVLGCCISDDGFTPLPIGRDGKIGGRATVLGRMDAFTGAFDSR